VLKQRVITAIILAVVVLTAIFALPTAWFAGFVAVVLAAALWEWSNLAAMTSTTGRVLYCALGIALIGVMAWGTAVASSPHERAITQILTLAAVWWALAIALVVTYPASSGTWQTMWQRGFMGILTLLPAWLAFVYLHAQASGQWLLLFVVALVAAADIGAYFAGTKFGHRKLAPSVSPGKSWEGLLGGLVSSFALVLIVWSLVWRERFDLVELLGVAAITVVVSVFGDLFESMLKRQRGVKDSSNLLPGHGGVMDRLDSLSAALPVFALGLLVVLK
jgi:phosphatidate cytidylyltransferase